MDGDPPSDYRYYNTDNGWPQVPRENWLDTAFSYIPFFGKYNKVPLGQIDLGAPSWPLAPVTVTKKLSKEQWRNIAKKREQKQKDKNRKLIESINLGKKQFSQEEKRDAIANKYDNFGGFDNFSNRVQEAQRYKAQAEYKKKKAEEESAARIINHLNSDPHAWEAYSPQMRDNDDPALHPGYWSRDAYQNMIKNQAAYYADKAPTLMNRLNWLSTWSKYYDDPNVKDLGENSALELLPAGMANPAKVIKTAEAIRGFEEAVNDMEKTRIANTALQDFSIFKPQVRTRFGGNKQPSTISWEDAQKIKPFISELDWSPEGWFEKASGRYYNDGTPNQYTDFDIERLNSHIPEYLEIEKRAKANGTWLKMPDGSIWPGDPREWVHYMSEAAQKHNPEVFWTGIKSPSIDSNYSGQLWGVYGQGRLSAAKARTYATNDDHVLPMFSKKDAPTTEYDANMNSWFNINGKRTNDIVNEDFSKGIQSVKINKVSDTGSNIIRPGNSRYSFGDALTDYDIVNNPGVVQNDIILAPGSFRKSLRGNNGDYVDPTHIYRALFPITIGGTTLGVPLFNMYGKNRKQ